MKHKFVRLEQFHELLSIVNALVHELFDGGLCVCMRMCTCVCACLYMLVCICMHVCHIIIDKLWHGIGIVGYISVPTL